ADPDGAGGRAWHRSRYECRAYSRPHAASLDRETTQKKASSPIRGSSAGLQAIWIRPAAGSRPGPGVAFRLGQPSMADSPPQRIHALLSATPAPERPSASHWRGFEKARHRAIAASVAVSRALAAGDRDKQNMDVLRASQGRMP